MSYQNYLAPHLYFPRKFEVPLSMKLHKPNHLVSAGDDFRVIPDFFKAFES